MAKLVVGLVVLAALAMSSVQPAVAARVIGSAAAVAVTAIDPHHADGTTCAGHSGAHGTLCCAASVCKSMAGLVMAAPLPAPVPVDLTYYLAGFLSRDGVSHLPTPPPPRRLA